MKLRWDLRSLTRTQDDGARFEKPEAAVECDESPRSFAR
jgi:hypothetical protein